MTAPSGADRRCGRCGRDLAPGAAYCRFCGARYEASAPDPGPAAPPPAVASDPRRGRPALWVAAAIVLLGAVAAVAILLASGGSSRTTVVVGKRAKAPAAQSPQETTAATPEGGDGGDGNRGEGSGSAGSSSGSAPPEGEPSAAASLGDGAEAGRYVQAGSFRTASHAEEERERIAAEGVDVTVISSNGAAELYPGFQVLLAGPIESAAQERSLVAALRRGGVPDAFARDLSPAPRIGGAAAAVGRWSGTLDRSSSEDPSLDASLPVNIEIDPGGGSGVLEVPGEGCSESLSLAETGPASLSYTQGASCVAGGSLFVRPGAGELMVALLPLSSDVLATGTLNPG